MGLKVQRERCLGLFLMTAVITSLRETHVFRKILRSGFRLWHTPKTCVSLMWHTPASCHHVNVTRFRLWHTPASCHHVNVSRFPPRVEFVPQRLGEAVLFNAEQRQGMAALRIPAVHGLNSLPAHGLNSLPVHGLTSLPVHGVSARCIMRACLPGNPTCQSAM